MVLHSKNYERQPKDQYKWSQARYVGPSTPLSGTNFLFFAKRKIGRPAVVLHSKTTRGNPKTSTSGRRPIRRTVDPSFPRQLPIFRGAKYINASSRLAPQKATDNPKTSTSGRRPSRRTVELTSARAPYPTPPTNHPPRLSSDRSSRLTPSDTLTTSTQNARVTTVLSKSRCVAVTENPAPTSVTSYLIRSVADPGDQPILALSPVAASGSAGSWSPAK